MRKFKSGNSYFLDKSKLSSVSVDALWKILNDYVKENTDGVSSISADSEKKSINITVKDLGSIPGFVEVDNAEFKMNMNIVRTMFLNTKFDRSSKNIVLCDENTENYPKANSIEYSVKCSVDDSERDSLFFHESALVDYTQDISKEDWNSSWNLALVSCKKTTIKTVTLIEEPMFFVAEKNGKLTVDSSFNALNSGIEEDLIQNFIRDYNERPYGIRISKSSSNETIVYSNFKIAVSMFKLLGKTVDGGESVPDAMHFIDFKSFVSSHIFTQFMNNLYESLTPVPGDI